MLLFLFLAALILAQHTIHVLLVEQQLAHLVTGGAVFGIRRLFFGKQLGIFLLQALDGGELFSRPDRQRLSSPPCGALMLSKVRTGMKLQHIYFCGSVDAVAYFKNQSELTRTARKLRAVFYYAAYSKAQSAHVFRKEYADNSDDCLRFCT